MENASKALVMAGGVLIALLIIGALMLMFNNLSVYQNQQDKDRENEQVAEFNNQFMPYEKDNLTLMELKSIYNKLESNNSIYPERNINHNIKVIYSNIDDDFKSLPEEDKQNARFSCKITGHNSDGYINKMEFSKN